MGYLAWFEWIGSYFIYFVSISTSYYKYYFQLSYLRLGDSTGLILLAGSRLGFKGLNSDMRETFELKWLSILEV